MRFEIAYCFPKGDEHLPYAFRFLQTYLSSPPNIEHATAILTDHGYEEQALDLFRVLPNVRAVATPDFAKDLSRYQAYALSSKAECLMFLGGSSYCRRPGWGLRAYTAFTSNGNQHLYGACGNTGNGPVRPHIRTTAFWCSPALFNRYPTRVTSHIQRYGMEHGEGCLTDWVRGQGLRAIVVTFSGAYDYPGWHDDPTGYARTTQATLLIGDRLTAPPYQAHA